MYEKNNEKDNEENENEEAEQSLDCDLENDETLSEEDDEEKESCADYLENDGVSHLLDGKKLSEPADHLTHLVVQVDGGLVLHS